MCEGKNQRAGIVLPPFFYDDLVNEPQRFLGDLCSRLGHSHEPAALKYWDFPHHGPAGNGAFFNIALRTSQAPITTGDDAYYARHAREQFYDTRWTEQLSQEKISCIKTSPEILAYRAKLGRSFADFDGYVERAGRAARQGKTLGHPSTGPV